MPGGFSGTHTEGSTTMPRELAAMRTMRPCLKLLTYSRRRILRNLPPDEKGRHPSTRSALAQIKHIASFVTLNLSEVGQKFGAACAFFGSYSS